MENKSRMQEVYERVMRRMAKFRKKTEDAMKQAENHVAENQVEDENKKESFFNWKKAACVVGGAALVAGAGYGVYKLLEEDNIEVPEASAMGFDDIIKE